MKPLDGDYTYIGEYLHCTFHNRGSVGGKTKDQLDDYLFLLINNSFHNISSGVCERNLYGTTPAETFVNI